MASKLIALAITFFLLAACSRPKGPIHFRPDSTAVAANENRPPAWMIDDPEPPVNDADPDTSGSNEMQPDTLAQPASPIPADSIPTLPAPALASTLPRLTDLFNDSNKYHYAAAERIGITPITGITGAYYLKRPLKRVATSQLYILDPLTHSLPYLVPEANTLLNDIARNFSDSLRSKKLPLHRFRVTSVLRTSQSVKKLRRVNRNAVDSSVHQLATTFDISYSTFVPDDTTRRLPDATLKTILAEVLRDLRAQNRCLVKFEQKSPCFHITATGR